MTMSKATQRVITLIACFQAISGLNVSPTTSVRRARTVLNYRNEEQEEFLIPVDVSYMRNQPVTNTLVGQILMDRYIVERQIPVSSEKCELYEAFRVDDAMRENPMIVKLSDTLNNIAAEYEVYTTVASQLCHEEQDLFVEIYDKIEQTHLNRGKSALIMEKGEDNLRFHLQRNGRFQGDELRVAMQRVIRTVQALHNKGMIWTEIKAENFIIKQDESIKGIDLESVIYHSNFLQMYSAESVPPEFPIDDLNLRVPEIQPEYSFDIWGLGILLFEMATGKPFYDGGLTNLEFIKVCWMNHSSII
jgi:serine/threonine protein kinase